MSAILLVLSWIFAGLTYMRAFRVFRIICIFRVFRVFAKDESFRRIVKALGSTGDQMFSILIILHLCSHVNSAFRIVIRKGLFIGA